MFRELSAPINIQWELTSWCNHNCVHCYNYWRSDSNVKISCINTGILDAVEREIISNKIFHATLTGGEPLAVIRSVYTTLKRLYDAGVTFGMNSNLSLLNDDLICLLKSLGIKSVLTSLISADQQINDGIAQRKGAFRKTTNGIELAIKKGIGVTVNMVVTKKNFHTIRETGVLARELGASMFCATKASAPQNCPDFSEFSIDGEQLSEMFRILLSINTSLGIKTDSLEHYPACIFPNQETRTHFGSRNCTAGKTSCTIGFDGGIRPCSHAPMSYGNVETDGIRQSWFRMSSWRKSELIPSYCRNICGESSNVCGGGCRIESYRKDGRLDGDDPYCLHIKPVPKSKTRTRIGNVIGRLKVGHNIRFRVEDFGAIAFCNQRNWLAIDRKLYDLLLECRESEKEVDASMIAGVYRKEEKEVVPTLSRLVSKKILTRERR